jgi:hypothetical protein
VGQVANRPRFRQGGNLPHVGICGVDVKPYCIAPRNGDGC